MRKNQPAMALKTVDVATMDVCSCEFDIRKDLHVYVNYVRERSVKRSVRENKISKADAKRIAKQLSDPEALTDIDEFGESPWLDVVDNLALGVGFVDYDTQGEYLGYTSSSPSFVDNYIDYNEPAYQRFLASSMQQQEQLLFDHLVGRYSNSDNEWFAPSAYGRLDTFSVWGCATGVVPGIKFDKVRSFLFKCLADCQPGIWYETASLIDYLKQNHPYFLIPQFPKFKYRTNEKDGRYGNFSEVDKASQTSDKISEKDRDAFERVEGRFVERFLENIPLTMGYVDLAYATSDNSGTKPSLGRIKAFKINGGFLPFMQGSLPEPAVTVLPNHEIHVESPWYPAGMLAKLEPLADLVSTDRICILKLSRTKAVAYLAEEEAADPKKDLESLTGQPLPANVAAELAEWAGQSESFVLYQGCGLVEGKNLPALIDPYEVETLSADLRLVQSPDTLFCELEQAEQVPVRVTHHANGFKRPPEGVQSVFIKNLKQQKKTKQKELITIRQQTSITLFFQDGVSLGVFTKALTENQCFVEIDKERRTVIYPTDQKAQVDSVIKQLKKNYRIKLVKEKG
ncbi:hypothetical protein DSCO28_43080 [Desulfosarcina ovata subsp. sediminis]|uniref:Helicase XPB/Ssl2 N-terminal domain-containing protein n=1 Tax=Desulfosarcina ovata subsp. sediminis TaxID=885957 RepID=A0A5K7ZU52_9BACT|nr:hypothetical protein [Desulfosarcina ovata]BBO83742.1 hypothetical protein DSCO28_43080 [Desulfosarcina ovata subsp. sediminis]